MADQEEQFKKQLVRRYKSGEATEEEIRALFTLINMDEADALAEDMDEEILKLQQPERRVYGSGRSIIWKIAASVLLILSLAFYFVYRHDQRNLAAVRKAGTENRSDITPGSNKAVLVLANGRKIDLNNTRNGRLAYENGIRISKSKEGQLIYEIRGTEGSGRATENTGISYNTISTPRGGQWEVILPDGSHVWLNAASSLRYPTSFSDGSRMVEMTGEAYFEVASKLKDGIVKGKDGKPEKVPFIVKSRGQEVEVLGTHFNINAYPDEDAIKTTLLEGSVRVNKSGKPDPVLLKPGEQSSVTGDHIYVQEANTAQAVAWKNGDFIFENQDLRMTMRQIARWYDVDVVYENAPETVKIGGDVSRSKNISAVLQAIELTGKVKFRIEGKRITVTR